METGCQTCGSARMDLRVRADEPEPMALPEEKRGISRLRNYFCGPVTVVTFSLESVCCVMQTDGRFPKLDEIRAKQKRRHFKNPHHCSGVIFT